VTKWLPFLRICAVDGCEDRAMVGSDRCSAHRRRVRLQPARGIRTAAEVLRPAGGAAGRVLRVHAVEVTRRN
jgi:hypothetical protein